MGVYGGNLLSASNYKVSEAAVCYEQGNCLGFCLLGGLISSGFGGMIQEWRKNMVLDDLRGRVGWDNLGTLLC